MAGTVTPLFTATHWITERRVIGATAIEIPLPGTILNLRTVMVQTDLDNTGRVFFSSMASVTAAGIDAGGQLSAGQAVTLPINFGDNSKLYLIGTAASQVVYISYFDMGSLC